MKKRSRGFTLVELMIVVAIIGVLAAIAIPAFRRYIKSTRVAEADSIMQKLANGASAYYTSEQKYTTPGGGDQPWHMGVVAQGLPTTAGMPVPFTAQVFPGGVQYDFNTTDGEGTYRNCATAPDGGAKVLPAGAPTPMMRATLNKLRMSIEDPIYFQYAYSSFGQGIDAEVRIGATVDWASGGVCHQIEQIITVDDDNQEVSVGPRTTTNEFE